MEVLNYNGLSYYDSKIKDYIDNNVNSKYKRFGIRILVDGKPPVDGENFVKSTTTMNLEGFNASNADLWYVLFKTFESKYKDIIIYAPYDADMLDYEIQIYADYSFYFSKNSSSSKFSSSFIDANGNDKWDSSAYGDGYYYVDIPESIIRCLYPTNFFDARLSSDVNSYTPIISADDNSSNFGSQYQLPTVSYLDELYYTKSKVNEEINANQLSVSDVEDIIEQMTTISTITIVQPSANNGTVTISGDIGKNNTSNENNVLNWIIKNTHRYIASASSSVANGLTIAQLADTGNTTTTFKFTDGSTRKITDAYDVYVKIPTFYYKGVNNGLTTKIYFARTNVDGTYHKYDGDHTLIGAFKATASGSYTGLHSQANVSALVETDYDTFYAKARQRSSGNNHFSLITYEVHKIIALLFYGYYGSVNSQALIGMGAPYDDDWDSVIYTGRTLPLGVTNTTTSNYTSYNTLNLWGIENVHNTIDEYIDNLKCDGTNWYELNYDGSQNRILPLGIKNTGGCIKQMMFDDYCDVTPKAVYQYDYTKQFTDNGGAGFYDGYVAARSGSGDYDDGGVGYLSCSSNAGSSDDNLGSRLLYHGKLNEVIKL